MSVLSDVVFDVESFEWADGELVVSGRWSGVRGMRFVRPTLTDPDGGRMLAKLDDKPWAAQEGDEWRAAFPCDEPPGDDAVFELEVGGGIVTEVPRSSGGRFPRPEPAARDDLATRFDLLRSERDAFKDERDTARKERTQARRALKNAEKKRDAVVKDLQSALIERDDANERSALLARDRDELEAAIAKLRAELDAERSRPEPVAPAPAPLPSREFTAEWRRPRAEAPDRGRQRLLAALALVAVLLLAVLVLAL